VTGGRGTSRAPYQGRPRGRNHTRRRSRLIVATVALGLVTGCGGSSSRNPTLDVDTSISLTGETLVPVSGGLCHVKGSIQNLSTVRIDATLQWQALDSNGKELGTTSITIDDLNSGETRAFETTGFVSSDSVVACSKVDTFPLKQATVRQG
jgi:hypothetical protein